MTANDVKAALAKHTRPNGAVIAAHFFKTGAGQYGEGDQFLGIKVPHIRAVCKQYKDLPLAEIQKLLDSPFHEHREAGVIMLADRYPKSSPQNQEKIFQLYLKNVYAGRINNWDLVDVTVEHVIGAHEYKTNRKLLFELAKSDDLWQKRAGIMSAFYYLKRGDASTTLELCKLLLHDPHDLIQKAVGWQLRELGKRVDRQILLKFLDQHAATMPRTALRYAIEHLDAKQKQYYMQQKSQK